MGLLILGLFLSAVTLGACMDGDSTSSSSSFFPIQVTVHSSNGTDLTPSTSVLHSHTSLLTHNKRSYTSPSIRGCAQADTYAPYSWCRHEVSPQSFEALCTLIPEAGRTNTLQDEIIGGGSCEVNEICVGSNSGEEGMLSQAYCVSTNHYVHIGQDPTDRNGQNVASSAVVAADFNTALHSNDTSSLAVEAVVTHMDNRVSLFATSVVMQAQTYNGVWRTLADGHAYCLRCSSLSLAPFPLTAQRVKVDMVLPDFSPTGLLWLASYSY